MFSNWQSEGLLDNVIFGWSIGCSQSKGLKGGPTRIPLIGLLVRHVDMLSNYVDLGGDCWYGQQMTPHVNR